MVTSRRKKRLIRLGLVLLVLLAGAAYYGLVLSDPSWFEVVTGEDGPPPTELDPDEALAATADAGIAEVEIAVTAKMPKEINDGFPRRSFSGEGGLDLGSSLASASYSMEDVPNSAGYMGHVSGDLEVVYSGSGFTATFPEMAEVLGDDADWMSYDFDALTNPRAVQLGIGQLREVGLSDPRLAMALLNGAEEATEGASGSGVFTTEIDLDAAVDATADTELGETLTLLRDRLRVSIAEAEVELDGEGRITGVDYSLAYPAAGDEVSVELQLDVTGFEGAPIEEPAEDVVLSYAEYLEL